MSEKSEQSEKEDQTQRECQDEEGISQVKNLESESTKQEPVTDVVIPESESNEQAPTETPTAEVPDDGGKTKIKFPKYGWSERAPDSDGDLLAPDPDVDLCQFFPTDFTLVCVDLSIDSLGFRFVY